MLTQDYSNSRMESREYFTGYYKPPDYYPITPPYTNSYDSPSLYARLDPKNDIYKFGEQSFYQSDKYSYVYCSSMTPPQSCYPTPPPPLTKSSSPEIFQVFKSRSSISSSEEEDLMICENREQRRSSVIMKVEDQIVTESQDLNVMAKSSSDSEEEIICKWELCYRVFKTLDALATHVTQSHAVATNGGLYYCKWHLCPRYERGFNARYKMLVHVRTHTKEKPHQCTQCDKSFSRAENLKIHIRSHSGEKPYVCSVEGCTKAYSNSSDRFKHTRTHSTEKPYCCKVPGCNKRYTDPSSLRKHVKTFKHTPHLSNSSSNKVAEQLPVVMDEYSDLVYRYDVSLDNFQPNRLSGYYHKQPNVNENCKCRCCDECFEQTSYHQTETYKLENMLDGVHLLTPIGSSEDSYRTWTENMCKVQDSIDIDVPLDLRIHKTDR